MSFIPVLWRGCTVDKEMVRNSGLLNYLEREDAVMADNGFCKGFISIEESETYFSCLL